MQGLVSKFAAVHGPDGVHGALDSGVVDEAHTAATGGALLVQHLDIQNGAVGGKPAQETANGVSIELPAIGIAVGKAGWCRGGVEPVTLVFEG